MLHIWLCPRRAAVFHIRELPFREPKRLRGVAARKSASARFRICFMNGWRRYADYFTDLTDLQHRLLRSGSNCCVGQIRRVAMKRERSREPGL